MLSKMLENVYEGLNAQKCGFFFFLNARSKVYLFSVYFVKCTRLACHPCGTIQDPHMKIEVIVNLGSVKCSIFCGVTEADTSGGVRN